MKTMKELQAQREGWQMDLRLKVKRSRGYIYRRTKKKPDEWGQE